MSTKIQNNDLGSVLWAWFLLVLYVLWLILVCMWLLSREFTRLIFFVINQATDSLLDRYDGLVVAISCTLWCLVFGIGYRVWIYPELTFRTQQEKVAAFWLFIALGFLWGASIAGWLLLEWWSGVEARLEPVYEPASQLGPGLKVVSPAPVDEKPYLASKAELEADMAAVGPVVREAAGGVVV
jgi:hypothetical protein